MAKQFRGIKGANASENGTHILFTGLVTLSYGDGHGVPNGARHGTSWSKQALYQIPNSRTYVGSVGVHIDVFIGAVGLGFFDNQRTIHDVSEGNEITGKGDGDGGDKNGKGRKTQGKKAEVIVYPSEAR